MNIGFYRAGLIGDNVVALHGIYATKFLYPNSKLIVYTNSFGINLYSQFDFIDCLVNIESLSDFELIENINSYMFGCFILTQPNRAKSRLLLQTNCKRIITFLTLWNLTKPRFERIFMSRDFSNISQYQRILNLVNKINPAHYKKHYKSIDFSSIRLTSKIDNKAKIAQFLLESKLDSKPLVIINPFVRSTYCNLSIEGYCRLIATLSSKYPQIAFVIPTYPENIDISSNLSGMSNVAIFCNDSNLLNIVALLESSCLLISPSTGISHIANNLRVPMIWLCSRRDKYLWRGDCMDLDFFIVLMQTSKKMSKINENGYIALVIEKFTKLIEIISKNTNGRI